jgi:hypothetical protein
MSTKYYPLGLMARGMEARKQLGTARELAPGSPWVLLQDGLLDDAAPRMFGGSTRAGIRKLERAAQLFATEQAAGSSAAGWALLETWQQLARMYAVVGQGQAATAAAERADVLKQQRTAPTLRRVAATLETTATS